MKKPSIFCKVLVENTNPIQEETGNLTDSTLLKFIFGVKDIVIDQWECTNNQDGIAELHIWLHVTGDGARWIDECIKQYLPGCKRCVGGFHVVEWNETVNKKADELAKQTSDDAKNIKSSLYALGKAPEHLTEKQEARLAEIALSDKRLYRAYVLKEKLRLIIHMHDVEEARHALQRFFWRATHSRIKEFRELAYKIRRHEENILNTLEMRMSNARIEATNNKIKLIIRQSYGFRNIQNMIDMVLLICSNLKVPLPNRPQIASQAR